jgi:hypothetical protein
LSSRKQKYSQSDFTYKDETQGELKNAIKTGLKCFDGI